MLHKETITQEIEYRICDFCEKQCQSFNLKQCHGCGLDICSNCGTWWSFDPWTNETLGDSRPLMCMVCNEKTLKFGKQVQKIWKEAREEVDLLEEECRNLCKQEASKNRNK